MALVRLRLSLPDRPGALARAAAVVAEHGGNITAVDVHHSGVLSATADLTVDFPAAPDLNGLRDALAEGGAATLVSHQEARLVDPVVAALQRASGMLAARSRDPDGDLAAAIAEACATPVAWVSPADEAVRWDAGRFAQERGGAIA
ncbi:MAG: ACT domain-containing protein, partial [Actinomycetes bacterium]